MNPPEFIYAVRPEAENRTVIASAISNGLRVELGYMKPDGEAIEARYVSPYELTDDDAADRVIGWDHDRRNYRTFRLDRIRASALIAVPAYQAEARDAG